jgi:alkylation response protein AidB-like acyl-CoA dehydrogenase
MTTNPPKSVEELRERTAAFAEKHVAPLAATWAREGRMGLESIRAAAEAGLTRVEVSRDYGGWDMGFGAKVAMLEELSKHSFDFAFSLTNTMSMGARLSRSPNRALVEKYVLPIMKAERFAATALSEPGVGSDFAAIATRAVKDGDGWILNGEKAWITNAAVADVFATYAQTDPEARGRGIVSFLVDGRREGFIRSAPERLSGGAAIGAGGFRLENYRARDDEVLTQPGGAAFKAAMSGVNAARTYVAAMCCAMVERCLEIAIAHGRSRKTFGTPLSAKQGLAWMMADAATDLEASRLLVQKALSLLDAGGDAAVANDSALAAAHAKKFAARMAVARISDLMQVMGASGLREDLPFVRHLASARVAHYVDGTTEIQNERIAAILLKDRP